MTSKEIFEAWYHPNFFVDPKTLAWEAWKQSRKNLEAEQAQEANSRIASLYEELRKAIDEGSESMTHDDALKQIAYWQDKCNQVQSVEPVWVSRLKCDVGCTKPEHCRDADKCSNDWEILHPAPPATGEHATELMGARAQKVWELRRLARNSRGEAVALFNGVADMLEADAQYEKLSDPAILHANLLRGLPAKLSKEQLIHLLGTDAKAQQVAVPLRECHYESPTLRVCNKCGQRHDKAIFASQGAKP